MQIENPISIEILKEEPPKPPTPEPIPEPVPEEPESSGSEDDIHFEEPRTLTLPFLDWQKS
jgi:hypothetical protein